MRLLTFGALILVAVASLPLGAQSCRTPDAASARFLEQVRSVATATDSAGAATRAKLGVPAVASAQITLENKDAVCTKAASVYDREVIRLQRTPSQASPAAPRQGRELLRGPGPRVSDAGIRVRHCHFPDQSVRVCQFVDAVVEWVFSGATLRTPRLTSGAFFLSAPNVGAIPPRRATAQTRERARERELRRVAHAVRNRAHRIARLT